MTTLETRGHLHDADATLLLKLLEEQLALVVLHFAVLHRQPVEAVVKLHRLVRRSAGLVLWPHS
jgi:hypothetical protein